jgi:hypothetical protein
VTAVEDRVTTFAPTVETRDGLREVIGRIHAEYAEMPGLSVTLPQAQRLWGIDYPTCIAAFRVLTDRGVVRRTPRGQYIRF